MMLTQRRNDFPKAGTQLFQEMTAVAQKILVVGGNGFLGWYHTPKETYFRLMWS
jgi:hypothetical protein